LSTFSILREQLTQSPSQAQFGRILESLLALESPEREMAQDYAKEHLKDWPEHAFIGAEKQLGKHPELQDLLPTFAFTGMECLEKCLESLTNNRLAMAFDWALSAWKRMRNNPIAELILTLDDKFPDLEFSGNAREQQRQWLEIAAERDTRQLGKLLDSLMDPRAVGACTERLLALQGWCDDPRTSAFLWNTLKEIPWTSNSAKKFWTQVFNRFGEVMDPRLKEAPQLFEQWNFRENMQEYLTQKTTKAIQKIKGATAEELPSGGAELLQKIQEAILLVKEENPNDALWEKLVQDPGNPSIRQELGEAFSALQDPRGEFILLQLKKKLSKDERSRIKAWQKEHRDAWLGGLAPFILKNEKYKQGFLHDIKLRQRFTTMDAYEKEYPLWSTIQKLECYYDAIQGLVNLPTLHSLTSLTLKFAEMEELQLLEELLPLLSKGHFPSLELITLQAQFSLYTHRIALAAWKVISEAFEKVEYVHWDQSKKFIFTRDKENKLSQMTVELLWKSRHVEHFLQGLPEDALTSFRVEAKEDTDWLSLPLSWQTQLQEVEGCQLENFSLTKETLALKESFVAMENYRELYALWYSEIPVLSQHNPLSTFIPYHKYIAENTGPEHRNSLAVSEDGRYFAALHHWNSELSLWDRQDGTETSIPATGNRISRILFFSLGKLWVEFVGGLDGEPSPTGRTVFQAWDIEAKSMTSEQISIPWKPERHYITPCALQAHPTEQSVYIAMDSELICLDIPTGTSKRFSLDETHDMTKLNISPCGRWLLVYGKDQKWNQRLGIWSTETEQLSHTFDQEFSSIVHFSKNGKHVYLASKQTLYKCHLESGELEVFYQGSFRGYPLLSPDESQVAFCNGDLGCDVIEMKSRQKWWAVQGHSGRDS